MRAAEATEINHCKKCGEPVRYATLQTGKTERGVAFEAEKVTGGGYELSEQEADADGTFTGRWVARYTKVADRTSKKAYRTHDCKPVPNFDDRDMAPIKIAGVWQLVHKGNMKVVQ